MKKILLGTVMGGISLGYAPESAAAITAQMNNLPQVMKDMAIVIDRSSNTDMNDAQGQLCKEGGLLRGRLLSAGKNCQAQDPARLAYLICNGVTDFKGSTCDKNIDKALGGDGKNGAMDAVIASIKGGASNIYQLVCTGDATFKAKLPGKLKGMDNYCPAPERPSTSPVGPKEQSMGLGEQEFAQGMYRADHEVLVARALKDLEEPNRQHDWSDLPQWTKNDVNAALDRVKRKTMVIENKINTTPDSSSLKAQLLEEAKKLNDAQNKLIAALNK